MKATTALTVYLEIEDSDKDATIEEIISRFDDARQQLKKDITKALESLPSYTYKDPLTCLDKGTISIKIEEHTEPILTKPDTTPNFTR